MDNGHFVPYETAKPFKVGWSYIDNIIAEAQGRVSKAVAKAKGEIEETASDIGRAAGKSWLKQNFAFLLLGVVLLVAIGAFLGRKR